VAANHPASIAVWLRYCRQGDDRGAFPDRLCPAQRSTGFGQGPIVMRNPRIKMDPETHCYCQLVAPLYRPADRLDIDICTPDIHRLLQIALIDNALTFVAGRLLQDRVLLADVRTYLEDIVAKGHRKFEQAADTLADFKQFMPADTLLFKTYKGTHHTRIGNDIDVLVKKGDLAGLHDALLAAGYGDVVLFPRHEHCIMVKKPGQINLHIQSRVHWCGKQFLDEAVIWDNPRMVTFAGQELETSNATADFLIHLAHINFEHPFFRLSELLYLFSLVPAVDFNLAWEQVGRYRWQRTFRRTVNMMNNIHMALYGEPVTDQVPCTDMHLTQLSFPFVFSRRHLIAAVLERRITYYLMGRMLKIGRVLLTGETCSYTQPPERTLYIRDGRQVIRESHIRGALNSARQRFLRALENRKRTVS
jgi:hypothetical protein